MIFELSKDKSLLYILSKVELDKETKALVNQKASPSEIKKSLERNINPSNIIQYRKFISIAKKEDYGESASDRGQRSNPTQVGRTSESTREETYIEADKEQKLRYASSKIKEKVEEMKSQSSQQRDLLFLEKSVDMLNKLISDVRIDTSVSPSLIKGTSAYKEVTRNQSEILIATLVKMNSEMGKQSGYLTNRFERFSVNKEFPIYKKKMYSRKDNKFSAIKPLRDINVQMLNNTYSELANAKLDNHDSSLISALSRIHSRRFKVEPKAVQDKAKIRGAAQSFREKLKTRDRTGLSQTFRKTKEIISKKIRGIETYLEEIDDDYKKLYSYTLKLVNVPEEVIASEVEEEYSEIINELMTSLKTLIVREVEGKKKIKVPKGTKTKEIKDKEGKVIVTESKFTAKEIYEDLMTNGEYSADLPKHIKELFDDVQAVKEKLPEIVEKRIEDKWEKLGELNSQLKAMELSKEGLNPIIEETKEKIKAFKEVMKKVESELDRPTKALNNELRQTVKLINSLSGIIRKVQNELNDLDDISQSQWNTWLKSKKDLATPKKSKGKKTSTVGVDMSGLKNLLELIPEQGKKQLEDLGMDAKDIREVNVAVGNLKGKFSDIDRSIQALYNLIPESEGEAKYSEWKEPSDAFDYESDSASWLGPEDERDKDYTTLRPTPKQKEQRGEEE